MIPLYTREAVRALDADAIERLRVPGLVLMENAGIGATQVLLSVCPEGARRALVVGGVGQNGGDAWVVARQLWVRGLAPRCVLVGDPEKVRGDARTNLDALRALGLDPLVCTDANLAQLSEAAAQADVIVDGLFGTGLDRDLSGFYARCIDCINASRVPTLALDLPSGVDANSGQVRGTAVQARWTVTFAAHKRGLHQFPGAARVGELRCVPIGVPAAAESQCCLIEGQDVAEQLPARPLDAHKGSNGRVLIIAGSQGKTGAALLAATSALRAGAGLVTIATDATTQRALEQKVVEVMTAGLVDQAPEKAALALAQTQDSALVGPGLGLTDDKRELARVLARDLRIPCVLDADALTALGLDFPLLRDAAGPRVLTPHPGEAARLLGCSIREVESDRYASAGRLADESGHVVVLKGARTVIAAPGGLMRVCAMGTPALGTAGTGDVLGGLIAALCVELRPFAAAWVGVALHARAGTLAARSDRGLLAREVARHLPGALESLRAGAHV